MSASGALSGKQWVDISPKPYLRFGDLPKEERSKNHLSGGKEDGVSVYDAHPHTGEPLDPDPRGISALARTGNDAMVGAESRLRKFRQGQMTAYHVTGHVVGNGRDNEPVLRGVKVARKLDSKHDIVPR